MKPKNSLTPDLVEITIDSLSYFGGRGVGRVDGLVIFIPGTAPGDRVLAKVTARKPRFLEGEIVKVLSTSAARRKPPCPVAGQCGGCSWQHVEYSEQIKAKEKILRDSLKKLDLSQTDWKPFIPAPDEFHYRNRIQLQIQNGHYGFFAAKTRTLVPIFECKIAEPALNEAMKTLKADTLSLKRVELSVDSQGQVHTSEGARGPEIALFGQVNTAQNERLKAMLVSAIAPEINWFMDLYCGSGNLTVPLHGKFPNIPGLAVEFSRASIDRAKTLGLGNIDWLHGDVGEVLSRQKVKAGRGLVVVDPPRQGIEKEALRQIVHHQPAQILYVSCNPMTFARDAAGFEASGYKLRQIQGLDMFPQTEHVELLGSLTKETSS